MNIMLPIGINLQARTAELNTLTTQLNFILIQDKDPTDSNREIEKLINEIVEKTLEILEIID